ncbi:hypothetical protein D3C76_720890 [compost metagenome]
MSWALPLRSFLRRNARTDFLENQALAEIQKHLTDDQRRRPLDLAHTSIAPESAMNYLVSLAIGLGVGLLYGALDFRSPAPPAIALVGLLGMLAGEKLWPMGRGLVAGWIS